MDPQPIIKAREELKKLLNVDYNDKDRKIDLILAQVTKDIIDTVVINKKR